MCRREGGALGGERNIVHQRGGWYEVGGIVDEKKKSKRRAISTIVFKLLKQLTGRTVVSK
jgi:hypothetical protein